MKKTSQENVINEAMAVKLFDIVFREGEATRYRAWKKCFDFYNKLHSKNYHCFNDLNETEKDLAVLNLGFYLASWGMYRGSSFITQFDSSIYEGIVDILLSKDYDMLWNLTFDKLSKNKDEIKTLLYNIRTKLNEYLTSYKHNIKETKNKSTSKTLITKILLGTIGCCPAYDRFFISVQDHGCTNFSNIKNIGMLLDFVLAKPIFKDLEKKYGDYPLMKIVDMAYFTMGLYNSIIRPEYFKPLVEKRYLDYFNSSKNDNSIPNEFLNRIKYVEKTLKAPQLISAIYECLEERYNLENNYEIGIEYANFNIIETFTLLWHACCLGEQLYSPMIERGIIGILLNRLNTLLN